MGGGLMQLVAMGAQDVFLTGNPQITFFKVVYRRHTNFSKECIKQEFNGSIAPTGISNVTCTLSRNGDLVQEVVLKSEVTIAANTETDIGSVTKPSLLQLPLDTITRLGLQIGDRVYLTGNLGAKGKANTYYFIKDVIPNNGGIDKVSLKNIYGSFIELNEVISTSVKLVKGILPNTDITNLIKSVEIEIGGQKIDKHYSAWLDIYNELFETKHDYRNMMTNVSAGSIKTIYIPLRFWFNINAGLALPLIALQYHEVKILANISVPLKCTLTNACLLVNYIYLDTDERRRFAQVSHEYLIEQIQHTGVETIDALSHSGRVDMNFNHPVKALFWKTDGKNFLTNAKIQLNGHDRFSSQSSDYFHLVQPYEAGLGHKKSMNDNNRVWGSIAECNKDNSVGMYSFCLKPGEHQPSGSCNFSRIDNARLTYYSDYKDVSSSLNLFVLNYNVLRIMSGMGGLTYSN